jgi:hypothetical protein
LETRRQEVLEDLTRQLPSWGFRWKLPEFAQRVQITFSHRLSYALGRSDPRKGLITLNDILA